nr:MAG TPA: hypothetical protein [Caudoviricetes sp.]
MKRIIITVVFTAVFTALLTAGVMIKTAQPDRMCDITWAGYTYHYE